MKIKIQQTIICAGICFLFLNACAPVNRLTRIKKTPHEYVRNYCCGDVAVSRSVDKRGPWIVYSDRNNNTTYYNPGGKVPLKKASYMEPFVVIGRKGEYLCLVKYSTEVIENGRIKNRKQAEYYGWVHQDNLLLSSHATTDIATGNSIKMITMVKDETPFPRSSDFFKSDSLTIYKDPELLTPAGKIPFQMPVYQVKKNPDRTKSLVIGTELINPDSTTTLVSGWLSSSLLMPFGSILYMDYSSLPIHSFNLYNQDMEDVQITNELFEQITTPYSSDRLSELSPVSYIQMDDTLSLIQTTLPVPVIDNRNNFVYSLSGKKIRQSDFRNIKENLTNMNILFVFSGQQLVYKRFEQLVSTLQGIKGVIDAHSAGYSFRLGAVMGFDKHQDRIKEISLNRNIDETLAALEQYSDNKSKVSVNRNDDAWDALRYAARMLNKHRDESNLVILVGENGNNREYMDSTLINHLADNNCRVLAYQLYSDEGNSFNNFVLQVEHLVKQSAKRISKNKQNILVHSEQLRPANQYTERAENAYSLDYPNASMTQGWIVFPKKRAELPTDLLISSADSLIGEIQADNQDVVSHLQTAFAEAGMGRTKLDSLWLAMEKLPNDFKVSSKTYKAISSAYPQTNYPLLLQVPTEEMAKGRYYYLLNESEMVNLRGLMEDLTRLRVDYKYNAGRVVKRERSQTCPELPEYYSRFDTTGVTHEYLNTSRVRRSMYKAYYKWIRSGKIYPMERSTIKRMSLSDAQQSIFVMPSFNEMMRTIKVGDLKKKKILADVELDQLLDYLLKKRKELEESIIPANKIEVNGETFYRIEATKLP